MTITSNGAYKGSDFSPTTPPLRQAWGMTSMLVVLYMLNWADKAVLGIVAQPLIEDIGLTGAQLGLAGSLFYFAFTLGGFLAGPLNKWMTLRWALVAMAVVWSVSMLPMLFAASFVALIVSRVVLGLAEGPNSAIVHTAAYSWHPPENRGLPGAAITCGGSIAKIAFAPLLAVIMANFGWRATFVTLSIACLVWVPIWLIFWRPGPYGEKTSPTDADTDGSPAHTQRVSWRQFMCTRTFLGAVLGAIPMYAIAGVVVTWLPSYLEVGLGYSRVASGSMLALPSVAAVVCLLSLNAFSDRAIRRGASVRVMRGVFPSIGLLLCGVLLVVVPYVDSAEIVVAMISVGYGLGIAILPQLTASTSLLLPRVQVAAGLGVFLALTSIGPLIAPYATGLIIDNASDAGDGYALAFQAMGLAALVGSLIAMLLVHPLRDRQQEWK